MALRRGWSGALADGGDALLQVPASARALAADARWAEGPPSPPLVLSGHAASLTSSY